MLTKVEDVLASLKVRREVEVAKAREILAKVEKKAVERAMEIYKALMEFSAKKARVVVVFWTSEEFYNN